MTTTKPTPFSSGALVYYPGNTKSVLLDMGNYPAFSTMVCQTWTYASGNWTLAIPGQGTSAAVAANPTPRTGGGIAYDGTNLVLFGGRGQQGTGLLGDTWLYSSAGTWALSSAGTGAGVGTTSPGPRQGHALTSLAGPSSCLLFGGKNQSNMLLDTWTWNGSAWSQITVANGTGPCARVDASIANLENKAVMFGGSAQNNDLQDTWVYNNTTSSWTQLTTNTPPSIRHGAAFVWDAVDNYYLLFGGANQMNCLGQTWSLTINGTVGTWTLLSPTISPPNTSYAAMTYHTPTTQVLMVGGEDQWDNLQNSTWAFTGGQWTTL